MPKNRPSPYAPGQFPRYRWDLIAPGDWSQLPPLGNSLAEFMRFGALWREKYPRARTVPQCVDYEIHAAVKADLRKARAITGLPLNTLPDWRGVWRIAELVVAERHHLSEKAVNNPRGRSSHGIDVGRVFRPVDDRKKPFRELERLADHWGRAEARARSRKIGPGARPFGGVTDGHWQYVKDHYASAFWEHILRDPFTRWHMEQRARFAYDYEVVRWPRSQTPPVHTYTTQMHRDWKQSNRVQDTPYDAIDTPDADLDYANRIRLEEAYQEMDQ